MKNNELAIVTMEDIALATELPYNEKQLSVLLRKTPSIYKRTRPAKGGGTWEYVTGGYVKKCLNLIFSWSWDFEIIDEIINIEAKQVIVKGKLTCRSNGLTIVKMQYGRQDLKFKRGENVPMDLGNDLKGAATDCLKKCASEIGIAADIYNKEEFREVRIEMDEPEETSEEMKRAQGFIQSAKNLQELEKREKEFEGAGLDLDEETQALLDDKKQVLTKKAG